MNIPNIEETAARLASFRQLHQMLNSRGGSYPAPGSDFWIKYMVDREWSCVSAQLDWPCKFVIEGDADNSVYADSVKQLWHSRLEQLIKQQLLENTCVNTET